MNIYDENEMDAPEKFRIDDAYGVVYEYDRESHAYIYFGHFHTFGITPKMTEKEQIRRINASLT